MLKCSSSMTSPTDMLNTGFISAAQLKSAANCLAAKDQLGSSALLEVTGLVRQVWRRLHLKLQINIIPDHFAWMERYYSVLNRFRLFFHAKNTKFRGEYTM